MAALSDRKPANASAGTLSCIKGHVKRDTVCYGIIRGFVNATVNAVVSC